MAREEDLDKPAEAISHAGPIRADRSSLLDGHGATNAHDEAIGSGESRRVRVGPTVTGASWATLPHVVALIVALGVWWLSLSDVDLAQMDDTGLVSVLPVWFYVAAAIVTISFCIALRHARSDVLLALHVVALIVILHGAASLIEGVPRLNATWRHSGIIDYIGRTHTVDPPLDAYFSWPGFFSFSALLVPITGYESALSIARWAPPFFNLIYLPPLLVIASSLTSDRRLVWLSCWCFYLANWIGQDYFAPQAFTMFLYLAVLALLLSAFRVRASAGQEEGWVDRALRRLRAREPTGTHPIVLSKPRIFAMGVVILSCLAIVPSHQLTPFALLLAVLSLALFGRISPRGIPLLIAVMCFAWLAFLALPYVRGHLSSLVDNIGDFEQNVDAGIASRVQGSSGHLFVVRTRLALSGFMWGAAVVGAVKRARHGMFDVACWILAAAPLVMVAAQPYGGEILLRAFLFSLPFTSFLVAALATSTLRLPSWGRLLTIGAASAVLLIACVIGKYGNESGEQFSALEVQAVSRLYAIADSRSMLVAASPSIPWKYQHYEWSHEVMSEWPGWQEILRRGPVDRSIVASLLEQMRQNDATKAFVIIERSQAEYAELLGLAPEGWIQRLQASLEVSELFTTVYRNGEASIFQFEPEPAS